MPWIANLESLFKKSPIPLSIEAVKAISSAVIVEPGPEDEIPDLTPVTTTSVSYTHLTLPTIYSV